MQWTLTHSDPTAEADETQTCVIDADTPGEAIEILRRQLPPGHKIHHVTRVGPDPSSAP